MAQNRPPTKTPPGNRSTGARTVSAPPRRFPVVPVVIGAVVVLAAIAIAVTSLGGGKKKKTTVATDNRPTLSQTQAVTTSGKALPDFDSPTGDPGVGATAPTVSGKSFDGTPVTISADGTPKIVLFVAHWCPHCQKEVPLLADWLSTHQVPAGVKVYTVSTGVSSQAPNFPPSAWLERNHWPFPTIADDAKGTAGKAYGLTGYPYFVALDGSGKVLARLSGEQPISAWEALLAKASGAAGG